MASNKNDLLSVTPMDIDFGIDLAIDMAHSRFLNDSNEILIPYVISIPGTGKTSIFEYKCKQRNFGSASYTIGLKPLEQLSGLPCIENADENEEQRKKVHWLAPELIEDIWELSRKYEFSAVLFDDFHLCTAQQQAYGFELFTFHKLHGYEFPKNVRFVIAGNTSSMAGAKQTLSAITNRMIQIPVKPNRKKWLTEFAEPNGLNSIVCSFLRNGSNEPLFCESEACTPTGSPRSWTGLANAIDITSKRIDLSKNLHIFKTLASGCVSQTAAAEFNMFFTTYSSVDVEGIFKNGGQIRISKPADKYPTLIAITDWVCGKIVDFCTSTKLNVAKHKKEFDEIQNILKIYGKIIEKFQKDGEGELAALSAHNLVHNNIKIEIGNKTISMLDIVTEFIRKEIIPSAVIHSIVKEKSDKGEKITKLASQLYDKK